MPEESLKNKTVKGVGWSMIERLSVQSIFFLITIVMARLLSPEDYGLIGLLAIFIEVSQALVDSGFTQALIRKQNRSEVDFCTVFYFNIIVSAILYLLLYFLAPIVARFYDSEVLCPVMRLVCLGIVINSFGIVQRAQFTLRVDFKTQTISSLIAALCSGVVGIWMAYRGYGIWSIAAQQISNYFCNVLILWILSKWRPKLLFSWSSFQAMFSFGLKLVLASILNTLYNNVYQIVIGKVFSPSKLGQYTRAKQFADFPSNNLSSIIQRVTFPVMCELQNDNERLKSAYIKTLRMITFVIFPLMVGLAGVAKPLVALLLGDKWAFSATLLSIICFSLMWNPIHSLNLNLLQVKGQSDLFLKLEIIKKIWGVSVLAATVPFGLLTMCYAMLPSTVVGLFINTYYTNKLIGVGFVRHIKEVAPFFIICLIMFIGLRFIHSIFDNDLLCLISSILIGIFFYVGTTKLLRIEEEKEFRLIMIKIVLKWKQGIKP